MPTLTAAAMATSTIRLGTLVASPNFRHPVPFARELITLDDVSGGRLTAGLGAGGEGWDATILGQAPWSPRRSGPITSTSSSRLLDLVLRGPTTTFTGEHFSADAAPNQPGCVQQPRVPFAIAATGPRGMRLAVEHTDIWVTNGSRSHTGPPLPAPEGAARRARADAAPRRPLRGGWARPGLVATASWSPGSRLDGGLGSVAAWRATRAAYEEIGVTDLVVHWPRPTEPYEGDPAILEHLVG